MSVPYTTEYYRWMQEGSRRSASEVVPLVLEILQPRRVIDVGCGTGSWLAVFKEHGIEDVLGVDGDYVDRSILEIPEEQFVAFDLSNALRLDRRFDLAVSLEVAQNLPHECAETFVDSLVGLAPVILFSASIPHQGGLVHGYLEPHKEGPHCKRVYPCQIKNRCYREPIVNSLMLLPGPHAECTFGGDRAVWGAQKEPVIAAAVGMGTRGGVKPA